MLDITSNILPIGNLVVVAVCCWCSDEDIKPYKIEASETCPTQHFDAAANISFDKPEVDRPPLIFRYLYICTGKHATLSQAELAVYLYRYIYRATTGQSVQ